MNNINIGDIVRYHDGRYGIVVDWNKDNINVDIMYVTFFDTPNKKYHYVMETSMAKYWERKWSKAS